MRILYPIIAKIICPQIHFTFSDDINEYDIDEEKVYINPNDNNDYGFFEHIKSFHNYPEAEKYSLRLWTLLHEIGHYFTIDEWINEDFDERNSYTFMDENDIVSTPEDKANLYFNIPAEFDATEWAIEYIENHKKLCKIFDKLLE